MVFFLDRLVEEVKQSCSVSLENEDVYMNTGFEDFTNCVVKRGRGIEDKEPFEFDAVSLSFLIDLNFKVTGYISRGNNSVISFLLSYLVGSTLKGKTLLL